MSSKDQYQSVNECEVISELIPDYAFGLTDANEQKAVESMLPNCPEAVRELADFRRLQVEMREATRQVAPPVHLRNRLLQLTSAPAPTVVQKPSGFRVSRPWMAAAAAVVLLIVTNIYWFNRVNTQGGGTTTIQRPDDSAFVLDSTNGLRWARLPAAQETMTAAAFLMWNADSQIGLMYAVNMPQLEQGRTYELWLTRDGERTSVGVFTVDETGEGALLFTSGAPIDEFAWAWITEEPANGGVQPSEFVIAKGEL